MSTTLTDAETPITFHYVARLHNGKREPGTIKHTSKARAAAALAGKSEYQSILSLNAAGGAERESRSKPKQKHLVAFIRQFAQLLNVGVTEREAIDKIIKSDCIDDLVLLRGLKKLSRDLSGGTILPDAMALQPYVFPRMMVETLRTGVKSEKLPEQAEQAADEMEAQADQAAKVKKSLAYPTVILVVSSAVFIFLMVKIVPQFADMYQEMGNGEVELPALTQLIMNISKNMSWMLPLAAFLLAALVFWYKRNAQEERVRRVMDNIKVNMPVLGALFRNIALVRFCNTMATLDAAQIPQKEALHTTAESVGNIRMRDAILKASRDLEHGFSRSMMTALRAEKLFPPYLLLFVEIGEQSSKLHDSLKPAGRYYSREVDQTMTNMSATIEPIFLLILSGMVAVIAMAIYLPYFSIGDLFTSY